MIYWMAINLMLPKTCYYQHVLFGDHKCFAVEMERNEMLLMKMPFDPFGCWSTSSMINSNS